MDSDAILDETRALYRQLLLVEPKDRLWAKKEWYLSLETRYGREGANYGSVLLLLLEDEACNSRREMNFIELAKSSLSHVGWLALLGVLILVGAGVALVWIGDAGDAQIKFGGFEMSTTSVGVAALGLGTILLLFTLRSIVGAVKHLGTVTSERSKDNHQDT